MPTVLMSGTEWAATVGDAPLRADLALSRIKEVIAYGENAIGEVMARLGGTAPPAKALMPKLYEYLDVVEKMRDGVAVALKANPDAELQAPAVQAGKAAGFKVIEESNRLVLKAQRGEKPGEMLEKLAAGVARKAFDVSHLVEKVGGPVVAAGLGWLIYRELKRGRRRGITSW
jgi:hypothetical protein